MKTAFHYEVRVRLIKLTNESNIEFQEFEEIFENENPIIAREKAFNHYQNIIEVLLESKNARYINDKQARAELKSFVDLEKNQKIIISQRETELNDLIGKGIGVFFIVNKPIEIEINNEKLKTILSQIELNNEFLIHGIGNIGGADDPQTIMDGLNEEFEYYQHYKYDTKKYETNVEFFEYDAGISETNSILSTPFDWSGYNVPYLESKQVQLETSGEEINIIKLIEKGESNQLEFKPTLLYNFSTGEAGIGIKAIIAKALCAFLNTNGGYLIIGIKDNGEIQGLKYDYKLAQGKNSKDFFQLEFDQMISHFFSFSIKSKISTEFIEINGLEVFVVAVAPSSRRPIFINGKDGKEFYVRGEASSQQIKDVEQIVNYCLDKWGQNQ